MSKLNICFLKGLVASVSMGLLLTPYAHGATRSDRLRIEYEAQLGQTGPVDQKLQSWLDQHVILFINGLGGDESTVFEYGQILKNDFNHNPLEFLVYTPSLKKTAEENASQIFNEILWLRNNRRVRKPILLMGHSAGGAEIFLTMLAHPELMAQNIVDRVVIVEGPVKGDPLADLLTRLGKIPASWSNFFAGWASGLSWVTSAKTLAPESYQPLVTAKMGLLSPPERARLSQGTFFVTVCQDPARPSYPKSSRYLFEFGNKIFADARQVQPAIREKTFDEYFASFGEWDDIVPLSSQSIDGFGTTFAPLYGSHMNFMTSMDRFMSTSTHAEVRAFVRALMQSISE